MGLRQWTVVVILSDVLALLSNFSVAEQGLIIFSGFTLLAAELMNTGVEKACDLVSTDDHPLAKKAKDASSAAVATTAIGGLSIWVLVLFG